MRNLLIDAIIHLSGDEYESKEHFIELAKASDDELVDRIIAIACFYKDQYEDLDNS